MNTAIPSDVIQLSELIFTWPGQDAPTLDVAELTIQRGEHVLIRGASGSGKTTLLNLLTGVNRPEQGLLRILGQDTNRLGIRARDQFRVDHMGVIFQQFNLLPYLSVLENVTLPCWFSRQRREKAGAVESTAVRLLGELQLSTDLHGKAVAELSTGQQQRVAVARALIGQPELIIADEPTSALDSDNRDRFMRLLMMEADQQDSTIIFVSHDASLAARFPRIVELKGINQVPAQ